MPNPPSAAKSLYPHLPTAERAERSPTGQSLAASMYPQQTPQAKRIQEWRARQKATLLRNLRELNQKIDKRLARERGR